MSNTCRWTQDEWDGDTYSTSCGDAFVFIDGTPEENGCKFCCHCGKPLEQVLLEDDEEE